MKRIYVTTGLAALVVGAALIAPTLRPDPRPDPQPPIQAVVTAPRAASPEQGARIELVFVLDTTGSMDGLIEGAKDTIWSVVNDFSSQKPRPEVHVGLVAYRDRGDAYVTKVFPLTSDLDEVYAQLSGLRADGGGDTPESVVRGLQEAVEQQPWTRQGRVFRSIFLVGDAPDKGYLDEKSPEAIVAMARQQNIYVNAIQCGSIEGTRADFANIASAGSGVFRAVAQDGAVERLEAPMDAELGRLEGALSRTLLSWGSRNDKRKTAGKVANVAEAPAATKASRLSVLSKSGGKVVTSSGRGDLLDDLASGEADFAAIPEAELPDELAPLDHDGRKEELARRQAERQRLQAEVDRLVKDRDAWVANERARDAADGETRYDREVVESSLEKLEALGYIE